MCSVFCVNTMKHYTLLYVGIIYISIELCVCKCIMNKNKFIPVCFKRFYSQYLYMETYLHLASQTPKNLQIEYITIQI